jgi:hypothetical protein
VVDVPEGGEIEDIEAAERLTVGILNGNPEQRAIEYAGTLRQVAEVLAIGAEEGLSFDAARHVPSYCSGMF